MDEWRLKGASLQFRVVGCVMFFIVAIGFGFYVHVVPWRNRSFDV